METAIKEREREIYRDRDKQIKTEIESQTVRKITEREADRLDKERDRTRETQS